MRSSEYSINVCRKKAREQEKEDGGREGRRQKEKMKRKRRRMSGELEMRPKETLRETSPAPLTF